MDSSDRTSNDQLVLEGTPNEASTPLKEGIPIGGASNVHEIGEETPSEVAAALMLPPRPTDTEPSRKRLLDQVLLSSYVLP